jgi:hypothetical protein
MDAKFTNKYQRPEATTITATAVRIVASSFHPDEKSGLHSSQ